jgi:heptosyltransferase I
MVFMRLAIVKLSALGDIVHAMVAVQLIKKYNKTISIDWVVEEDYKELLDHHPEINKVHVINLKKAKYKKSIFLFIKEFRKVRQIGNFDLVIDMQGLIKSAIVSKIIPSRLTIGFDKFSSREGFSALFYNKRLNYGYEKNVIDRNISLVEFAIGLHVNKQDIINKAPILFSSKKYLMTNISNTKKNILIIPGASNESKCYPISNLAKLTKLIDENFLIIWGNEKEKMMADQIKIISPKVHICNKLTIDSLISLISQMDLVIGPDTGPTHIAWAMNVASITLFGSTPGYRNTFITTNNKIIESKSKVDPLYINKKDYSIGDIRVSEIAKMVKKLLGL